MAGAVLEALCCELNILALPRTDAVQAARELTEARRRAQQVLLPFTELRSVQAFLRLIDDKAQEIGLFAHDVDAEQLRPPFCSHRRAEFLTSLQQSAAVLVEELRGQRDIARREISSAIERAFAPINEVLRRHRFGEGLEKCQAV